MTYLVFNCFNAFCGRFYLKRVRLDRSCDSRTTSTAWRRELIRSKRGNSILQANDFIHT